MKGDGALGIFNSPGPLVSANCPCSALYKEGMAQRKLEEKGVRREQKKGWQLQSRNTPEIICKKLFTTGKGRIVKARLYSGCRTGHKTLAVGKGRQLRIEGVAG